MRKLFIIPFVFFATSAIGQLLSNHSMVKTVYGNSYQAVIDKAALLNIRTVPSGYQQSAQSNFFAALKAHGIISKWDILKVYYVDAASSFTDINWVGPSAHVSSRVNAPLYIRNGGMKFNATDNYIDLNWKPSDGVNYTQNSAEHIIYYKDIPAGFVNAAGDGSSNAAFTQLSFFNPQQSSNGVYVLVNNADDATVITDSQFDLADGMYFFGRTSSTNVFAKKNTGTRITKTTVSTGKNSINQLLGAWSVDGTPYTTFNGRTIGVYAAGAQLTTTEEDNFVSDWNTYKAAIDASPAIATIGTMYNVSSWASLSDFTTNGATVSAVSNKLHFTGGAGTFDQTLDWHQTKLAKWSMTFRFIVGLINSSSNGPGIGVRSSNTFVPEGLVLNFVMNTSGEAGKIQLYSTTSGSPTATTTALGFSLNDEIELTLSLDNDIATISGTNITTAASVTPVTLQAVSNLINTGTFSIFNSGGTFDVTRLTISSQEYYQPQLMVIGDSKTQRYAASRQFFAYPYLVQDQYGPLTVYAGDGNQTRDVLSSIDEIINVIKPEKVLLAIGSNDKRGSVVDATMKSNYASIVSQLETAGIRVIKTTGYKESVLDQSSLSTYIIANYSAGDVIDTLPTTLTLNGDGIHPDDAGHVTISGLLLSSGKF